MFETIDLTIDTVDKAVQIFAKARNSPIDAENNMKDMTKLFYQHKNFIGIGLTKNKVLVGFGALIAMNGNTAWIPYVGVHPEFQGQGGGKVIMQRLLDLANQHSWVSVELVASNAGFPLYQKFGFRTDYSVGNFEIKRLKSSNPVDTLQIKTIQAGESLPEWLLDFDKKNVGIDRSNIFPVHNLSNLVLLSHDQNAYGLIYGQRIGPIVSESLEVARNILYKGFELGATLAVLPIKDDVLNFFKEKIDLQIVPDSHGTKMTFGNHINYNPDHIIGLRSMAFG